LGYKVEVPPKRDVDAWRQLQEAQLAKRDALLAAAKLERVRSRHALEQEIRRLEAMPSNPGRARAIQLCSQLVNLLGQWQRHMGSQHFGIHRVLQFNQHQS
jgi:hypothetical protein